MPQKPRNKNLVAKAKTMAGTHHLAENQARQYKITDRTADGKPPRSRLHEIFESRQAPGVIISNKSIRAVAKQPRSEFEAKLNRMSEHGYDVREGKFFATEQERVEYFAKQDLPIPTRMTKSEFQSETASKEREKKAKDTAWRQSLFDNSVEEAAMQVDGIQMPTGQIADRDSIMKAIGTDHEAKKFHDMNVNNGGGMIVADGFTI